MNTQRVLIAGPTPPPYHGVAVFIRDLIASDALGGSPASPFILEHLDTSDPRDASNLGRWDAGNLALGFSNLASMALRLIRRRHALVYVPISQNIPAFLRDALFIFQARLLGARVVLQLHGGYFREFYCQAPGWFQAVAKFALNRARAVIVLSEEFRPIFEGLVPSERIHVAENGVPDILNGTASPAARPSASRTILFLSTLARTKGILDLLRAVALLRSDFAGIRLRVAGNWSEADTQAEAVQIIASENLTECVEFTGNIDGAAKPEFLSSGDIFCLPTRYPYEGQPLAILEAMSAGLPVLATRHGAIGSTVVDGVTGKLIGRDAGPAALAAALREMLSNPSQLRALGTAGRQRYLDKYTLAHCHHRLFEVFHAALKSGAPE